MKPTNNLRWLSTGNPHQPTVPQQWWAHDPDDYEAWILKVNGEWRDIPMETLALRLAEELEKYDIGNLQLLVAAAELRRLHEVNEELLKTMRRLACLGNGDNYGNSDGNIIAQVALNKATGE